MRAIGFLPLLLTLPMFAGVTYAAEKEVGPFNQSRAVIKSFAGNLVVEIGEGSEISGLLEAPDDRIDDIEISESGGAVSITGPRLTGNRSTTVVGNTTVVVTGGGRAEVTIGGVDATVVSTDDEPVSLRLTVPAGTELTLDRFAGDATIGNTDAALTVQLLSGTVEAGKVTDAHLAINGSGGIRVRETAGALVMTVNGSGTVDVANGAVSDLSGRINGSGSLRFDGRAETAEVSINGAGTVEIAHVEAKPRTRLAGAGRISIGNW